MASRQVRADLVSKTSPLATTGTSTDLTTFAILFQSASPEYLCLRVRPCTHNLCVPISSSRFEISSTVSGPEPVPSRILALTGESTSEIIESVIATRSSGVPINAAPAHILVTFGAGQPKFKSIISAVSSSIFAAVTISIGLPPNIWGINGFSST